MYHYNNTNTYSYKQLKEMLTYDSITKKMTESYENNDVVTSNVSTDVSRVTGRVKWFNNKAGYGFITVSDGPHTGDVFVHHSAITVNEEQYRYLVQGEYVEFECIPVDSGPHQWQAAHVTGPNSGPMMCETRRVMRSTRPTPSSSDEHPSQSRPPRQTRENDDGQHGSRPPRQYQRLGSQTQRGRYSQPPQPPQSGDNEYEWLLVRKHSHGSGTRPPVRRAVRHVSRAEQ